MAKIKKLSVIAAALCTVVATAGTFGACGESIDYESLDYNGWAAIEDSTWDKKTISYQYEIERIYKTGGGGAGAGIANTFLINLYSDGTMLMWQAGLYTTSATMKDAAWADEARHIVWDFYGFWTQDETAINLYYICSLAPEGTTVKTDESWVDLTNYCFNFTIDSVGGKYVLTQKDDANEALYYLNMSMNGEKFPISFVSVDPMTGSDVKYKTLQSWVDTYINEEFWEA